MGAEICYSGRITFDEPVPTSTIPGELTTLRRLEGDDLFDLAFTDGALAGLVMDDGACFGHTRQWRYALHLLETIARE